MHLELRKCFTTYTSCKATVFFVHLVCPSDLATCFHQKHDAIKWPNWGLVKSDPYEQSAQTRSKWMFTTVSIKTKRSWAFFWWVPFSTQPVGPIHSRILTFEAFLRACPIPTRATSIHKSCFFDKILCHFNDTRSSYKDITLWNKCKKTGREGFYCCCSGQGSNQGL